MDQNQDRRRGGGHFHRGRRGQDRRGFERRTPPAQAPEAQSRDNVDVEQIMRDIRARISKQHGIELSNQQIQDLAARRLESILDPRGVRPALLDELRRSAGAPAKQPAPAPEPPYTFEDSTLYESHRGLLRFIRRLLNPILKLLFNPNPLIKTLNIQSRLNVEAATREAAQARQQAEWNALHYELVQRMVTEVSRVSMEMQALAVKIESLAGKVDFNERRVRGIESAAYQSRPSNRPVETQVAASAPPAAEFSSAGESAGEGQAASGAASPGMPGPSGQPGEGSRRRRRRRRGRRGGGAAQEPSSAAGMAAAPAADTVDIDDGGDNGDEGADEDTQMETSAGIAAEPPAIAAEPPPPLPLPVEAVPEVTHDAAPAPASNEPVARDQGDPGATE